MERSKTTSRGFSLIEVVVTMTILAILMTFATPSVTRTMEQSHADMVGAGLRMIATAQRFYWLENRTYAPTLQVLIDDNLIDNDLSLNSPRYEFSIAAADAASFAAQARRRQFDSFGSPSYDGAWQGTFSIDQTGVISGSIVGPTGTFSGQTPEISPSF